ncbi:E3 ubiquitin/ISG15 ligase TRIM25 isoform X1 [Esox lucius]|uniref:E3 ubiquitin/ISG15 ligase TRIM25 isoform X1 n=1 Tax=Esox lucius TaxID=8010 RepID=UPI001477182D|nr:E3 ubiquitin/ISG15 ligase TRIM25 isoform X1 [Esox lucius]
MESLSCPICLEHLKEPVTTACGHSYCMDCIEGCWDQDEAKGVYRCPQCRQTFIPRPVLMKNIMLADVVEKLKKTGLQVSPSAHYYAGPGDVACDVCTGRRFTAVKTCLGCLASYCNTHLQPHCQSEELKMHKLVDTSTELQDKVCSHPESQPEVICQTDQQCLCYLCTMEEHTGHERVSSETKKADKQKQLGLKQGKLHYQQRIQESERKLMELKQTMTIITDFTQSAVEDSEKIFAEMICSMERRRSEVKDMIRAQENAAARRTEGLQKILEQEIAELMRRRDAELDQLSSTEEHIPFLQTAQSLGDLVDPKGLCSPLISSALGFDDLKRKITELKKRLDHICQEEVEKMSCSAIEHHCKKWGSITPVHSVLTTPSYQVTGQEVTLNLLRKEQGFGFRMVGGYDTFEKILITDIVRHSAAHRDGRLKRGDELVAVNNVPVNQKTHEDVVALIRKAGQNGQVTLMVRRNIQTDIYHQESKGM